MMLKTIGSLIIATLLLLGCDENEKQPEGDCHDPDLFSSVSQRNFKMGFSTWSYGPDEEDRQDTYMFINDHADIYSEQIDDKIPWDAFINDTPLPDQYINEINAKVGLKPANHQLLLSVSLLNTDRDDLLEGYDGTTPDYSQLNDQKIADAYYEHVKYLIEAFDPNYLVIAMEVNDLRINSESKWEPYTLLIDDVTSKIKSDYPPLMVSESITLHNWYNPEVSNPETYISEMADYVNQLDFAAISYYPFFKGQHTKEQFQQAFNFLHQHINKPIAFVETAHLAEDLSVDSYDLFIESDACEQNAYLETLLTNAQNEDYEFVIWWTHRDFDELWQTFPDNVKDIGKLWRDTGLLDEDGNERPALTTWDLVLEK